MATRGDALSRHPDRWAAAGVAVAAFVLYACTLPPSFGMWDTAELQTVAAILGIAHPPGAPAFTLLGFAFIHAVPFGNDAWRLGIMCALCGAGTAALAYLAARHFAVSRVLAAVCALGFACALVPWRDATRAETLDLATFARALALVFALRWHVRQRIRDLSVAAFAAGLGCATHGLAIFLLPSLALLVFTRRAALQREAVLASLGGFVLGVLPFAYLPLRSAWIDAHHLEPLAALGLPAGQAFWNYDDPSSPARFWHCVTGADFHVKGGFEGYLDVRRFPHYVDRASRLVAQTYGYAGTMLALGGACLFVVAGRADRAAVVLAGFAAIPYTEAYVDLQDPERYYLLTFWCAAVLMAIALDRLAALFELRPGTLGRYAVALGLALSFGTVGLTERAKIFGQRNDTTGPQYVAQIKAVTPDDAIVLADWAYATPLAYAAYVERNFGHRSVIASSPTQYIARFGGWARQRPLFFVGFDSDLHIPDWHAQPVWLGTYYAYRLTK